MTSGQDRHEGAVAPGQADGSAPSAQQPQRQGVPLGAILVLVLIVGVAISTTVFLLARGRMALPSFGRSRDPLDPLLVISTRTPTPTSFLTPTRTRVAVALPTHRALRTATFTPAPPPTPTASPTVAPPAEREDSPPTATPTTELLLTETPIAPVPEPTPHVLVVGNPVRLRAGPGPAYDTVGYARKGDALPLTGRTENGEYWQVSYEGRLAWMLASLAEPQAGAESVPVIHELPPTPTATPTATATPTLTPIPPPAPVLLEPSAGAVFEDKVRFKFTWYRRLLPHEKFSIYVRSAHENADFDWWVSDQDILAGGGAIYAVPGGFLYEVNSGLGSIPSGEAFWRVAVFDDTPGVKRPVCPWSEERRIVRK